MKKDSKFDDIENAWDKFVGNCHVKRALEIALAGSHTLTVFGHPNNGKDLLKIILGDKLQFIQLCPCGNINNPFVVCACTYKKVIKYHASKEYKKARNSDILIEIVQPKSTDYKQKGESFQKVKDRVYGIRSVRNLFVIDVMKIDAKSILKLAINKLRLNLKEVQQIKSVAYTIAKLDHEIKIKSEHIAEAIQYKTIGRE